MSNLNDENLVLVQDEDISASQMNIDNLKNILEMQENPHPLVILSIVIILIFIIYYIHVIFVKTCFNGDWHNKNGELKSVYHNKWNDNIVVNGGSRGYARGNSVYILIGGKTQLGVLSGREIYWVNSDDVWRKTMCVI